jgi:hypothetical protein
MEQRPYFRSWPHGNGRLGVRGRNRNRATRNALRCIGARAPEFAATRARIFVDGLHRAADALDAFAEGRALDLTGVLIGSTREPVGLWFQHVPELNMLFEAIATLEAVTQGGTKAEPGNPVRERARSLAEFLRAAAGDTGVGVAAYSAVR